jgi:hypothetical protein
VIATMAPTAVMVMASATSVPAAVVVMASATSAPAAIAIVASIATAPTIPPAAVVPSTVATSVSIPATVVVAAGSVPTTVVAVAITIASAIAVVLAVVAAAAVVTRVAAVVAAAIVRGRGDVAGRVVGAAVIRIVVIRVAVAGVIPVAGSDSDSEGGLGVRPRSSRQSYREQETRERDEQFLGHFCILNGANTKVPDMLRHSEKMYFSVKKYHLSPWIGSFFHNADASR